MCLNKTTTATNVCHDQVWSLNNHPDGVVSIISCNTFDIPLANIIAQVVWVRTNCSYGAPLGTAYQDPVYNYPGVSLYQTSGMSMFDGWIKNTCVMTVMKAMSDGTWFDLEVKARGFLLDGVGSNGEILLRRINGCGDMSSWNFTWADVVYPDLTWDMEASSTIFVKKGVQKACIGTAMQQAGGVMDQCI